MLFSSLSFIFIFLPVFLAAYYLTPERYRNVTLLIGSLIFYAIGEPRYIVLFAFSLVLNYLLYLAMDHCRSMTNVKRQGSTIVTSTAAPTVPGSEKALLALTVVFNVAMLFFFKYFGFVLENVRAATGTTGAEIKVLLPLGISFYTFQILSFQIDRYRGEIKEPVSFVEFSTYVAMFPQLIAGPIVRYGEVGGELKSRRVGLANIEEGLMDFCVGLGLKVLLANQIGTLWTNISEGGGAVSTPVAWLGAYAFSMQLYFDFWGYSVMAIGLAKLMGFYVPENFDIPYESRSVSEFWRRWHMTMGRFFRLYVYFPLGGSHCSLPRTIFNLFVVWALTGFWHGADWNFLIWGLIFFVLISIEKTGLGKWLERTKVLGHVLILVLIPATWMVFAISDLPELASYMKAMVGAAAGAAPGLAMFTRLIKRYWWLLALGVFFCTRFPRDFYRKHKKNLVVKACVLAIFIFSAIMIQRGSSNPFLYFRF